MVKMVKTKPADCQEEAEVCLTLLQKLQLVGERIVTGASVNA